MESMHFTYPETEGDWMRLQESWKSSDGMDCDVEDYILRVNFWNPVITMCVRRWPVF